MGHPRVWGSGLRESLGLLGGLGVHGGIGSLH